MSQETNYIQLSDESVEQIKSLCDLVARKNRKNDQSRTMAVGIADYAKNWRAVSHRQAVWLARNADFHKRPRPRELREIVVPCKESACEKQRQEEQTSSVDARYDDADDLISSLASILRELDAIISRLREHKYT